MQIINFFKKAYLQKIKGLYLPRDLISYAIKRNYNKIAVIDGRREITYGQLYERAKRLANALLSLGIKKGDRLAVLIYNCQEYFEIRAATYLTGIVLVPLVWDLNSEDIIFILNDCSVEAFIYHPQILAQDLEVIKERTQVKKYFPISGAKENTYENLISEGSTLEPKAKIRINDLASINFSSGTTGRPKGVLLTQKNWISSFYNYLLNSRHAQDNELIVLHVLSFATAGGTSILPILLLGAKNIILDKFDVEKAVSIILEYKVNSIFLTPSLLNSTIDYCKNKGIILPLTTIVIGTEPMPQAKFRQAIEFFGPIIQQGYGMCEILPPLSLLSCQDYMVNGTISEAKLLSAGRILNDVRLKIIDKEGRQLSPNKIGRIVLKSTTISGGYWHNPELTKSFYRNGWFYSDDFGYLDSSGYLYILGRAEDILRESQGHLFFAQHIEEVLHQHPQVLMAYVFKNKDGRIIASVSLRRDQKNAESENLRNFCKQRLSQEGLPMPDIFTILSEMPVSATGKIDRNKIIAKYESSK